MKQPSMRILPGILVLFFCLVLTGCNSTSLYSGLDEKEANVMLSVLLEQGFRAEKISSGKSGFAITVGRNEVVGALRVLESANLPRKKFESLGTVFSNEGLISSPLQERARFTYALSQELSETCSTIDGVLTARVHVVLEEAKEMDEKPVPASAAVLIRYVSSFDIESSVVRIRKLVAQSVPGLAYDNVSVALFPIRESVSLPAPKKDVEIAGVAVSRDSLSSFWLLLVGGVGLGVILGLAVMLVLRSSSKHDDAFDNNEGR
ncbi:type III secretion system inner membrane ring lipoprotein SctJ [Halodesulfovibrio marinisediminis]|uniref:Type III secretion protein J n=1 Tax=Halodesulfovibrio marinisediminis DSM 17456 TaxID=1121457 RepID=A0A1N6I900_9BACT|nr:type III secretion inner membrane ring lipoprotein SctJ [Halodesulfovibrio marinisediminis]SIO28494.1 type III secretion protein J [Halodesulfovibrio marinisediminis DSM 17456]